MIIICEISLFPMCFNWNKYNLKSISLVLSFLVLKTYNFKKHSFLSLLTLSSYDQSAKK